MAQVKISALLWLLKDVRKGVGPVEPALGGGWG